VLIIIIIINCAYLTQDLCYRQLFEYADLGSVKTFLQRPPSDLSDHCVITVSMLLEYSVQIAHGLLYLESQTFVHCDLAACNIMRTSGPQVRRRFIYYH